MGGLYLTWCLGWFHRLENYPKHRGWSAIVFSMSNLSLVLLFIVSWGKETPTKNKFSLPRVWMTSLMPSNLPFSIPCDRPQGCVPSSEAQPRCTRTQWRGDIFTTEFCFWNALAITFEFLWSKNVASRRWHLEKIYRSLSPFFWVLWAVRLKALSWLWSCPNHVWLTLPWFPLHAGLAHLNYYSCNGTEVLLVIYHQEKLIYSQLICFLISRS